jgi:hypothetical protein
MFNDLMENIEWFFNLHDKNKDGYLTKDEVLTLSESFLVRCLFYLFYLSETPFFLVHFPFRNWRCIFRSCKSIHGKCF